MQAVFKDCGIGGLGMDASQACLLGLSSFDEALAQIESCLLTDGHEGPVAFHVSLCPTNMKLLQTSLCLFLRLTKMSQNPMLCAFVVILRLPSR